MNTWIVGGIVLASTFGAMLLGRRVRILLPKEHLTPETGDVMKLVIGVVGTLSALVLGLMISSARGSYEHQRSEVQDLGAKLISLDRSLIAFGPETKQLRKDLKVMVAGAVKEIWPADFGESARLAPAGAGEAWLQSLQALTPATDAQRFHQNRAVALTVDLLATRWLLYQQSMGSASVILISIITIWFSVMFFCIGMLAPRNPTVLVMLLICALSVAGAVILSLELDRPFDGILRLSSDPILRALSHMGP